MKHKRLRAQVVIALLGVSLGITNVSLSASVAVPDKANSKGPLVRQSESGVTVVDIRRPNVKGLSHNEYTDLQVDTTGLILMNSVKPVRTELAGYVTGNKGLVGTSAKAILNEVTGPKASIIGGAVEVAGTKADVIIANPNGLSINNGSFINVHGVTLTTGKPQLLNGEISAYDVTGGTIRVDGQGLQTGDASPATILAEAMELNAGIWAKDITVATGQNVVHLGHGLRVEKQGDTTKVGLDSSKLGGMYANTITLIGTNQGLGVNSGGNLLAKRGDLVVDSQGKVYYTGDVASTEGNVSITSQSDIEGSGTVVANEARVDVRAKGNLSLAGKVSGKETTLQSSKDVTLTGATLVGKEALEVTGKNVSLLSDSAVQGSDVLLKANGNAKAVDSTVNATNTLNLIGDETILLEGKSELTSGNSIHMVSNQIEVGADTKVEAQDVAVTAKQDLTHKGTMKGTQSVEAKADRIALHETSQVQGGRVIIHGNSLLEAKGRVAGDSVNLTAEDNLRLTHATVQGESPVDLNGKHLAVEDTTIQSNGSANLKANELILNKTKVIAGSAHLTGSEEIKLDSSQVETSQHLAVDTKRSLELNESVLRSGETLSVSANSITNPKGSKLSGTNVAITADVLTNQGTITSSEETYVKANRIDNLNTGKIFGNTVAIDAETLVQQGSMDGPAPVLMGREAVELGVEYLKNTDHSLIKSDGNLTIGGNLDENHKAIGESARIDNESATIEANQRLSIHAKELVNTNLHYTKKVVELGREERHEVSGATVPGRYVINDTNPYTVEDYREGRIPKTSVAIYNDESDHLTIYGKWDENWSKYDYERVTTGEVLDESDPGRLVAGGDLVLRGGIITNDKSHILAGGTVDAKVQELKNLDLPSHQTISDKGTKTDVWRNHKRGRDKTGYRTRDYEETKEVLSTTPAAVERAHAEIELANPRVEGATKPVLERIQLPQGAVVTKSVVPLTTGSSLYELASHPSATYVFETDPDFTDKRKFLSSDYFLSGLALDPGHTMKRLGDGYYEQALIKEQLFGLTGKRYLGNYTNDDAMMKGFMDAGIAFGKASGAKVGVALTKDQLANLKESMVWLVETSVVLPSGEVVKALVPQLYVVEQAGELPPHMAVISGHDVDLQVASNLLQEGSIMATNGVALSAENIHNHKGTITGQTITLDGADSLRVTGGTIQAKEYLQLSAKNDVTIASSTNRINDTLGHVEHIDKVVSLSVTNPGGTISIAAGNALAVKGATISANGEGSHVKLQGKSVEIGTVDTSYDRTIATDANNRRRDYRSREVGSTISSGGTIAIASDLDMTLRGASVMATGDTSLTAKGTVQISTAKETIGSVEDRKTVGRSGGGSKEVRYFHDEVSETKSNGTTLSGSNVTVTANTVGLEGSMVTAKDAMKLTGAEGVTITSATNTRSASGTFDKKKRSPVKRERVQETYMNQGTSTVSATVSGGTVDVTSGGATTIQGSNVIGKDTVTISSKGDLALITSADAETASFTSKKKTSGLMTSGLGFTLGSAKSDVNTQSKSSTPVGSTIGSLEGVVNLRSDDDVMAKTAIIQGKKDVRISGNSVTITGDTATYEGTAKSASKSSGLSISLGGTVADAITTAQGLVRSAKGRDNKGLAGLELVEAGKEVKGAVKAVEAYRAYTPENLVKAMPTNRFADGSTNLLGADQDLAKGGFTQAGQGTNADLIRTNSNYVKEKQAKKDALLNVRVGFGSSKSQSSEAVTENTFQGGRVKSETRTVYIEARDNAVAEANEKNDEGKVSVVGSTLEGESVDLRGTKGVELKAGTSTRHETIDSKQKGFSVGVSLSPTTGGILGFDASAHKGMGTSERTVETHVSTTVTAKTLASLESEGDTTIVDSTMHGETVAVDTAGNLSIQSLQDTDIYRSKQKQVGVSLSTMPKDKLGGSLSMQNNAMNSDYASVKTQAGIYGGDGGYAVHTKGTTSLEGAIIASTDDGTKNVLQTDDLVTRDIQNKASYTSKGTGISFVKKDDAKFNEKGLTPNLPMSSTKETSSVTTSAIGNGDIRVDNQTVDIEALNRDTVNTLNSLDTIFDKKKVQERQELAKLFAKNSFEQIHYWEPKTQEEKTSKAAVHGIIAEISARIAGNPSRSGFYAGMTNKMLFDEMARVTNDNPATMQWVSAAIGGSLNQVAGNGFAVGANISQAGTKYNGYKEIRRTEGMYFVDMNGVWWKVENGEDKYKGNNPPRPGTIYVQQDARPGSQAKGWDYRLNANGTATYIEGNVVKYGEEGYTESDEYILSGTRALTAASLDYRSIRAGFRVGAGNAIETSYTIASDGRDEVYSIPDIRARQSINGLFAAGMVIGGASGASTKSPQGVVEGVWKGGMVGVAVNAGISTAGNVIIEKIKDKIAPSLSEEDRKEENKKFYENVEDMIHD